jgi:hypothetical protein
MPLEQEPTQVTPANGKDHKPVAVPVPKQSIGRVELVRKANDGGKPAIEEPLSKPKIEVARDEAISKPRIELPDEPASKPTIELSKSDEPASKPKIELPKSDERGSKPKIALERDDASKKTEAAKRDEPLSKPKIDVSKPPPAPTAKADTGVRRVAPREPSTIELTDDTLEELNISEVSRTPPPVPAPALELDEDDDSERLSLHDMEPLRPSQAERLDTKQLTSPPPPPDRDSDPIPRGTDTWHVPKPKPSSKTWIAVAAAAGVLFLVGLGVGRLLEDDEASASADLQRPLATSTPPEEAELPQGLDTPEQPIPEEPVAAEAPEAEPPPPPEPTEIRLVGLPESAEVLLNRAPVRGSTLVLPPGHEAHVLEFRGIEAPRAEEAEEKPPREERRAERPTRAERRRADRTPRMRTRRTEQASAMEAPAVAAATERRRPTVVVDPGF